MKPQKGKKIGEIPESKLKKLSGWKNKMVVHCRNKKEIKEADMKSLNGKKQKVVKEKPDYIFQCHKCSHNVYITKASIMKMVKLDCPECGEEPYENWMFIGEGNFYTR